MWITHAKVLDETGKFKQVHLEINQGKITAIVSAEKNIPDSSENVNARGKLIHSGFIDVHVHLREPGFESKETIETGSRAAAAGGFTTIACMPNTRPVIDTIETVESVKKIIQEKSIVNVLVYAAITKGELGRELTDFERLKQSGAFAFTDDGVGVQNAWMMKQAMLQAKQLGMPIVAHCEEDSLIQKGCVTEGKFSKDHGLAGIPNECEAIQISRDVLLAEATKVHYHVCHVSTAQSVRVIRDAKKAGIHVTAEVCPHHLCLSEEDIPGLDANWKMNPPLRSKVDVQACIEALEDGTIDMVVTDHAPHTKEEKDKGMQLAPFGIVGLETAFPLLYTEFVTTGRWSLSFLLEKMSKQPARVFELEAKGQIQIGADADLVMIDLELEKEVDPSQFLSKGRNTPFTGRKLKGWPVLTMVNGNIVWKEIVEG